MTFQPSKVSLKKKSNNRNQHHNLRLSQSIARSNLRIICPHHRRTSLLSQSVVLAKRSKSLMKRPLNKDNSKRCSRAMLIRKYSNVANHKKTTSAIGSHHHDVMMASMTSRATKLNKRTIVTSTSQVSLAARQKTS